jgi:purine-cytosine permease-like protein
MSNTRTLLAILLAPALPTLYFLIAYSDADSGSSAGFFILIISLSVSYIAFVVFGLPLLALLKRKRKLNIAYVSVGGAILGMIVFYLFGFVLAALLESSRDISPNLNELIAGAALGVLVALPFSLIAGYPLFGSEHGEKTGT